MTAEYEQSLRISLTKLIKRIAREHMRRYVIPSRKYAWHYKKFKTLYWPSGIRRVAPVLDIVVCLVGSQHYLNCYHKVLRVLYKIHSYDLKGQINLWLICFCDDVAIYEPRKLPDIDSVISELVKCGCSSFDSLVKFFRHYKFVQNPPIAKSHKFDFGLLVVLCSDFDETVHSELVRHVVHLGPKIVWILCGGRGKFWEPIPYGHIYRVCCLGGE